MSCCRNLRTDLLTGADATGDTVEWNYLGFASDGTGIGGPYTDTPSVYPKVIANCVAACATGTAVNVVGNPLTGSDDDTDVAVCFEGVDAGYYKFEYSITAGTCSDTQEVIVEVLDPPDVGTNASLTYCDTDGPFNMYAAWDNETSAPANGLATTIGWDSIAPSVPNGAHDDVGTLTNITDDTFDPSDLFGVIDPRIYVFTFSATAAAVAPNYMINCADCTQESTLTITVTTAPDAGTPAEQTVCNV